MLPVLLTLVGVLLFLSGMLLGATKVLRYFEDADLDGSLRADPDESTKRHMYARYGATWDYSSRRFTNDPVQTLPKDYCLCGYKDECAVWCGPGHRDGKCEGPEATRNG